MKTQRISVAISAFVLSVILSANCLAAGGYYLPYVTGEMSSPSYWTEETDILMSYEEIEQLNKEALSTKGTKSHFFRHAFTSKILTIFPRILLFANFLTQNRIERILKCVSFLA